MKLNEWYSSSSSHTTSDGIHTNAIDFNIPSNASKHVGTVTALIGISVRRMHLAERGTTYVRNSFYHFYIRATSASIPCARLCGVSVCRRRCMFGCFVSARDRYSIYKRVKRKKHECEQNTLIWSHVVMHTIRSLH